MNSVTHQAGPVAIRQRLDPTLYEASMFLTRRTLFAAAAASLAAMPALAQSADPRLTDRALGNPKAPVTVQEFFSLTCTHCAAWAKGVFPQVKTNLIDTGKIYYIYRDFPLDQVALTAAMVARALPPERYEPFVNALLATQDHWAFARDVNTNDELYKMAALAGMPRPLFDSTIADDKLRAAILAAQDAGSKKYSVDSTPTFVINEKPHAGEQSYDTFAKLVADAA
jgi:protein-disulfide isomerase